MNRTGYQAIGYLAWEGGKLYLRHRYGRTAKRLALGTGVLVVGSAVAFVAWQRRPA